MSKICWKGGALMAPLPAVLVTSGTLENPNIMTAAWTGIVSTHPPKTYISVRPSRYTYELIQKNRSFVINLTPASLVRAVDFCGVRSGRDMNKFIKNNLTPEASFSVEAPSLAEAPLSLECRVTDIIPLGSHDMFLADVVSTAVREDLIDPKGRLALEKADLLTYLHGEYYTLGHKIGSFGYSVRKKEKKHPSQKTGGTERPEASSGKKRALGGKVLPANKPSGGKKSASKKTVSSDD